MLKQILNKKTGSVLKHSFRFFGKYEYVRKKYITSSKWTIMMDTDDQVPCH